MNVPLLAARPPAANLWVMLDRVYTVMGRQITARLSEFELTTPQFRVLRQLAEQPGSPSEIAERIGVTAGNLTGIIDRLEQGGLLTRQRTEDRRSLSLQITTAGQLLLTRAVPELHGYLQEIFSPLTEQEIVQAMIRMELLERHLIDLQHRRQQGSDQPTNGRQP